MQRNGQAITELAMFDAFLSEYGKPVESDDADPPPTPAPAPAPPPGPVPVGKPHDGLVGFGSRASAPDARLVLSMGEISYYSSKDALQALLLKQELTLVLLRQ